MPSSKDKLRKKAEESISGQLKILKDYKGKIVFIPGNIDWAKGRKEGLKYIKNQRKYLEKELDEKNIFLPEKGNPGPLEISLTKDIVLLIIDSQWWLHEHDKSYNDIEDEAEIFVQLKDIINRNKEKKIIVASHHPLYSVGKHGGHFRYVLLHNLLHGTRSLVDHIEPRAHSHFQVYPDFPFIGRRHELDANEADQNDR